MVPVPFGWIDFYLNVFSVFRFKYRSELTVHLTHHTGEMNFSCSGCAKKFRDQLLRLPSRREKETEYSRIFLNIINIIFKF
jgi:hypothetical protein